MFMPLGAHSHKPIGTHGFQESGLCLHIKKLHKRDNSLGLVGFVISLQFFEFDFHGVIYLSPFLLHFFCFLLRNIWLSHDGFQSFIFLPKISHFHQVLQAAIVAYSEIDVTNCIPFELLVDIV